MTSILTPEEVTAAWEASGRWGNETWETHRARISASLESAILAKLASQAGELPEQCGFGLDMYGHITAFRSNAEAAAGMSPGCTVPLFTADQLTRHTASLAARVEVLERALRQIAALDYSRGAVNGAAYDAVLAARAALFPAKKD
jgi:hypothetical protein